jgi:UDP-glucose 4-epimerase
MSDLKNKHVLVTGGGGFVGAPTVRALFAEGAKVRVLDAVESDRLDGVDCELRIGDISDTEVVTAACEGVELVVHLAVLPLNQANLDPSLAFETNVRGSFNVFDAAGKAGISRVVYSSASSAYGPTDAYPIVEDQPLRPNAFYPASKAAAEMLLRGLAGLYGYNFVILRYMNVYGPGQTAGVVPAVARSLLAGNAPKLTGDGSQAFDFVHIEDCAQANMRSIAADGSGAELNVGSGQATSLNELVATMTDLLGLDLTPEYDGPVSTAPPRVGSIDRAGELVGYKPAISLRDGLADVLEFQRGLAAAS